MIIVVPSSDRLTAWSSTLGPINLIQSSIIKSNRSNINNAICNTKQRNTINITTNKCLATFTNFFQLLVRFSISSNFPIFSLSNFYHLWLALAKFCQLMMTEKNIASSSPNKPQTTSTKGLIIENVWSQTNLNNKWQIWINSN